MELNDEGGYKTSTLIYDALLRPRQTQTMTPNGGRVMTDTFYDSRGWTATKFNGWWDPATLPNTTLVTPPSLNPAAHVYSSDVFTYDGLGRAVYDMHDQDGAMISNSITAYDGDTVTTIAPTGGVSETVHTDTIGHTVAYDQYSSAPVLHTPANTFTGTFYVTGGTVVSTVYDYDSRGNQTTAVQAGGPTWTSTFDMLGHLTSKVDADAGTLTRLTYDADGNVLQSTSSRGKTISYQYDALDRKTASYASAVAAQAPANQLASWVYDNSNNAIPGMKYPVGQLTTATSYVGGTGGAAYVRQQKNFNIFGESTGVTVTIPAAEGSLAGQYTFNQLHSTATGLALTDVFPAAGGLPAKQVTHTYAGVMDMPDTLGSDIIGYDLGRRPPSGCRRLGRRRRACSRPSRAAS
jgi:YD repeat-containing protein